MSGPFDQNTCLFRRNCVKVVILALSVKVTSIRKLCSNELHCWWEQLFRTAWVSLEYKSLLLSTLLVSIMINTFHTSYNPPPVPPRTAYSRPLPALPGNTPLVKFLSVMLLLLTMLTFGGFFYLFLKLNMVRPVWILFQNLLQRIYGKTGQNL